jgi:hypothetical protein
MKTLISISEFPNVGPENTAYAQTYKLKTCTFCSEQATKIALFDNGNDIIIQQRYCDRHAKGIKKSYDAGFQSMAESYFFEDKSTD